MESPPKDPLDVVTMVWKDLYGDAACQEAKTRGGRTTTEPSRFWRELLRALCE